MNIAITGSSGFIGNYLLQYLAGKGHRVLALQRKKPNYLPEGAAFQQYELAKDLEPNLLQGIDWVVHCAYAPYSITQKNATALNVHGTKHLYKQCKEAGCKMLFFSTMSAHEKALSHYGKHKFQLENEIDTAQHAVVRPGLVLGNGGLFGNLYQVISKGKLVPLVGGGKQPIQTIAIEDLAKAVETIITKNIYGTYTLAEPDAISMKTLYGTMAALAGNKPIMLPVPYLPVKMACAMAETLKIQLPVTTENVLGLKQLVAEDNTQDLQKLSLQPKTYEQTLEKLVKRS